MKNKKLTVVTGVILVIIMLFSSVSIGAYGIETTTVPAEETTTALPEESTTAPVEETTTDVAEETTTEVTEETTEAPTEETTTEAPEETTTESTTDGDHTDEYWDGYDEGYDDGYDEGYTDGFWDGYYDYESGDDYSEGYWDGYYEGYYEAMNNGGNVITIFDRWDAFYWDLLERIEIIKETFMEYIYRIFRLGDYAIDEPAEIKDTSFIPDGTQATLAGDEEAEALCEEFNNLINNYIYGYHPDLYVTEKFETIVDLVDCSGGFLVKKKAQEIIDENIIDYVDEEYFSEYSYLYTVQDTLIYPAGLTTAEKTVNEDGSTEYKFVLAEEATFYDGYDTYAVKLNKDGEAVYTNNFQHYYVAYTLDIDALYLDPAVITRAEVQYPGATITAKVDDQGRLEYYNIEMPVKGSGEGKISFIKIDATLEGESNLYYTFDYNV